MAVGKRGILKGRKMVGVVTHGLLAVAVVISSLFISIASGAVSTPQFSPDGGTFSSPQNVVVTCVTGGATIHYTTNGIDPTESDPVVASGGSILVDHSLTLKAKAWKNTQSSAVKSADYQIVVATPSFNPDGGTYYGQQNVIVTCATAGATIHYTTNGIDPTESDPVVASGGTVLVEYSLTLKAKGWKDGLTPSGTKSADYIIDLPYSGGSGTPDDPYQIATKADLLTLRATPADFSKCFIMTSDIDLSGQVYDTAVIALDTEGARGFQGTPFTGIFDGNDHTISGLAISSTVGGNDFLGLFGCSSGIIKNVTMVGCSIVGRAGTNVEDSVYIGGLTGFSQGSFISNCHVSGSLGGFAYLGGLVGCTQATTIIRCSSSATAAASDDFVGGLVGAHYGGSIVQSHATGDVSGEYYVGGLIGFAGYDDSVRISNCYARGRASGVWHVGGFLGVISGSGGTVAKCYSTGFVSGRFCIGGFIGSLDESCDCPVTSCFWDKQTSGRITSAGGTGKTTAEMQDINTFLSAGWDFVGETTNGTDDYWQITAGSYPTLFYSEAEVPPILPKPVLNPHAGVYNTPQSVVVSCLTLGATMHYTTNGIDPTESDPVIISGTSVYVAQSLTLKSRAWKEGWAASDVKSGYYELKPAAPVFLPAGGAYGADMDVTVTCATTDAVIHYTTDGTDPTEGDLAIASGDSVFVSVEPATTLKAKAFKVTWSPSDTTTGVYCLPSAIHVKPAGSDDANGLSWATAKATLQGALDTAVSGDQIWVAAGTYKPTSDYGLGIGDRGKHFRAKNGVPIYGGFAGTETGLSQRDWEDNVTILSGDLDGDGAISNGDAYAVFYQPDNITLILDGFTIMGGNWSGSPEFYEGGGGIYCEGSSLEITNCTFRDNYGMGIFLYGGYIDDANIRNCLFERNKWSGLHAWFFSTRIAVLNCKFRGNGVSGVWLDTPGGAAEFTNCEFVGNAESYYGAGGVFCRTDAADFWNCTFTGNAGGGLYCDMFYSTEPAIVELGNCILWGNGGPNFSADPEDVAYTITYSDISPLQTGMGNINADPQFVRNPSPGVDGTWGTPDDDYGDLRLRGDSPCLDEGSNALVPAGVTTDIDGLPRISDDDDDGTPTVDMGAYEGLKVTAPVFAPGGGVYCSEQYVEVTCATADAIIHYTTNGIDPTESDPVIASGGAILVDQSLTLKAKAWKTGWNPSGIASATYTIIPVSLLTYVDAASPNDPGSGTYGDPFRRIQDGVDAAPDETTVVVLPGTYTGSGNRNIGFGGKAITLRGTDPNDPAIVASTIIDCNGMDRALYFHGGEDANSIVEGFTVMHGYDGGQEHVVAGSAVACIGSSPTIRRCIIRENHGYVAGIYCQSGSVTIDSCVISDNAATGGLVGGIFVDSGSAAIRNSIISHNSGPWVAVCGTHCSLLLVNCTIAGNSGMAGTAGGIACDNTNLAMVNSIVWGNSPYDLTALTSTVDVSYSCVSGGVAGEGNTALDPMFVSLSGGDMRLTVGSPCIDTGSNTVVTEPDDLEGRDRMVDGDCDSIAVVDMGAYEFDWHRIGDLDSQCDVDFVDYAMLTDWWGQSCSSGNSWCYRADIDESGTVDIVDVALVVEHWLEGK